MPTQKFHFQILGWGLPPVLRARNRGGERRATDATVGGVVDELGEGVGVVEGRRQHREEVLQGEDGQHRRAVHVHVDDALQL